MKHVTLAAQALTDTHRRLKELASQAVSKGDWRAVSTLATWTEKLERVLIETDASAFVPDKPTNPAPKSTLKQPRGRGTANETRLVGGDQPGHKPARAAARTTRQTSKDYPVFVREADALVKIGWSKKAKKEYEHRAPRRALDLLAAKIEGLVTKSGRFSVDTILPVTDPNTDEALPSYQLYLCIAWMRTTGLINQHGRQGYSLPFDQKDLRARVHDAWNDTRTR